MKELGFSFREMLDKIPTLAWSCLPDGTAEFLNQQWVDYTGLSSEEAAGWGWQAAIHPEDIEKLMDTWLRLLNIGEAGEEEARLRRFDGGYRWFLFRVIPVRDEEGKVVRWYGTNSDIEDLKRAEYLLSAEKRTLEMIVDEASLTDILEVLCRSIDAQIPNTITTVLLMDPDGKRLWPTAGPRVPRGWTQAITPLQIGPCKGSCGTAAFLKEPVITSDIASDPLWVGYQDIALSHGIRASWSQPLVSQSQEVFGTFAMYFAEPRTPSDSDLQLINTAGHIALIAVQRTRADEQLRRSEAYLAEAQRLSRTGSFGWNVLTGEMVWSKETFCILGYDQEMKPSLDLVFERVYPEDLALVRQTITRASLESTNVDFEHRLLLPDGSVKHVHLLSHAARDQAVALEFVGAISDVTARKIAEGKIRQKEEELRRIVDLIPQIVIVIAPDGSPLYANRVALDYMGVRQEEVSFVGFGGRLSHPEDVKKLRSLRRESLVRGVPFELEQRMLGKHGGYRWFLFRYNPLKDESGKLIQWYVTATDIQDRRQAEERIRNENLALREEIDTASMFEEIVGSSEALSKVLQQVKRVAPVDSTVLILGETGTGKELIARAIHKRSLRSSRAFIRVNCAAISPGLIASELFGHEKGAFTGATHRRLGRFELADHGTILLDEIGELPHEIQLALLRVLQEREIERVGGSQPISVDVRVLAATNRDLKTAVAAGTFRSDLFYRLNVFPLEIPPLCARPEDTALLIEYFVHRYARKLGKPIRGVDKKTLDLLQAYHWPGNVRELQNVIERAVILCDKEHLSIDPSWIYQEGQLLQSGPPRSRTAPATDERTIIEMALKKTGGRISGAKGAAAKLGLPPSTLESKIKALKINKYQFKPL